jgi:hypothetical protein
MILLIYYREEFDCFELTTFHAAKDHFTATTINGNLIKKDELKNWVQIKVLSGDKIIYTLRGDKFKF